MHIYHFSGLTPLVLLGKQIVSAPVMLFFVLNGHSWSFRLVFLSKLRCIVADCGILEVIRVPRYVVAINRRAD